MNKPNSRVTRVTRSAPAAAGNLVSVVTPAFISLVGKPANQRPFKVIRSDNEEAQDASRTVRTSRRGTAATMKTARRSDDGIIALTFPANYTKEDAETSLITFGLTGYTLTESGGIFTACRSDPDLQLIAKSPKIRVTSDGIVAAMDEAVYTPQTPKPVTGGVTLVRFEFDSKAFTEESVSAWLTQNSVDNTGDGIQNSGGAVISVKRRDTTEGVEVRRMEVEVGVVAVVVQSEVYDVPDMFAAGVIEAAYGNWGWGHLDFSASMADIAFCDALDRAEDRIGSVLRRILFYSELPLELRKTLVTTALEQYGSFVINAIDALPRQAIVLATRSESNVHTKESTAMSTVDQQAAAKAQELKRAEEIVAAAAKETAAAAEAAAKSAADATPVTRGELTAAITTAMTAAMANVTRAEPAAAAAAAPNAAEAAPVAISRADLTTILGDVLKPVSERIAKLEGSTVVRSDTGDQAHVKPEEKPGEKKNVFRGALGLPGRDK